MSIYELLLIFTALFASTAFFAPPIHGLTTRKQGETKSQATLRVLERHADFIITLITLGFALGTLDTVLWVSQNSEQALVVNLACWWFMGGIVAAIFKHESFPPRHSDASRAGFLLASDWFYVTSWVGCLLQLFIAAYAAENSKQH